MAFRDLLPSSRVQDPRHTLPVPTDLRAWADRMQVSGLSDDVQKLIQQRWQTWITLALRAEGLARDNHPHNMKRIVRDKGRGKYPFR
jgi:hypothetical protein